MVAETFLPANSSHIAKASYDDATEELTVEFASGDQYVYTNVPVRAFRGFQTAPSAGAYFARAIKGVYPYERM